MISINPNYADAYYKRALAYRDKGDYNEAIADFEAALRINPKCNITKKWLKNVRQEQR
jgi:tetratricopeptide (TPR) repeat protein